MLPLNMMENIAAKLTLLVLSEYTQFVRLKYARNGFRW